MALGGEVTYIIGPPGTGKTFTLAAIALQHLRLGQSVLIASHTNIAIDNAVMKLSDLCKDTGNSQSLQQGLVVRYGTVQKAELKESSSYADIYLPKIAQRLGVSLHEQKKLLKDTLQTLDQHIAASQRSQDTEQYRQQQAKLLERLTTLQRELEHLEQQERQRLTILRQKEDQLIQNIQGAEHALIDANRRLARVNAEREEARNTLTHWHQEEQRLRAHLLEARAMGRVKRILKGMRLEKIESDAGQALHEVYELTQKLDHLEYNFNSLLPTLAQYKQQQQSYEEALRNVRVELKAPLEEAQRMQALKRQVEKDRQTYEQRRVAHEQQQQAARSHVQSILDQRIQIEQQLSILDQQLRDIEQRIVTQARVVGTTLSKTYMNKVIAGRRFDVVIVDEVSMASLPSLYVALAHANQSVVLIGDPQQLAPIVTAKTPLADKWLGKDLFTRRDISLDAALRSYRHSVLLDIQSRMPAQISVIARHHVYENILKDGSHQAKTVPVLSESPLVLCDTHDAFPITTRPPNGRSRQNFYTAFCSLEFARKVVNALPERKGSGEPVIGIVTPYRPQAKLLQKMVLDAGLQKLVQAGTIHRFQGLEFDVVIFDTVESPGLPHGNFLSGSYGSDAMRLVNVAVTRPKQKLFIVANRSYIRQTFSATSTLRLAVEEAAHAAIVQSLDIVGISWTSFLKSASRQRPGVDEKELFRHSTATQQPLILKPLQDESNTIEHIKSAERFYALFKDEIQAARESISIASPFLTSTRVDDILPLLKDAQQRGVKVEIFTKPLDENNEDTEEKQKRKEWDRMAMDVLKTTGIELLHRYKMHMKWAIIDKRILYYGSLNILSHKDTLESMLRFTHPLLAQEIYDVLRSHQDDSAATHAIFENFDDTTVETIDVSVKELPASSSLCKCGQPLISKPGKNGALYGCPNFPNCRYQTTENITLSHLQQIKRLQNKACPRCGSATRLHLQDWPRRVMLACDTRCGWRQKITFTR
jgi:AAA domain/PLD-like domain